MRNQFNELLLRLNIKRKGAVAELVRLDNKFFELGENITNEQRRMDKLVQQALRLTEEIVAQEAKLSKMVGQARLSFSMIWSAGAQVASMVQRIAGEAGVEWADILAQSMSVLSNMIAIAYASAAIWAGTGPAGVIMAGVQIANASIAMVLQAQTAAYQDNLNRNREIQSSMMVGEMPF